MEMSQREQTATQVQDDPKARTMLRQAFEKTARWQPDFKGFTADLSVNVSGKEAKGTVTVKGPGEVTVTLPDPDLQKWAGEQIGMIAVHRGPRSFEQSDGQYSLTVGEDTDHPLGPRLTIHGGQMESFYRVKGDRITQINRKSPRMAFTINVEDSAVTQDGKYLTTRYTVYYSSPQDGKLTNVDSFTDTHIRVASSDLPANRRIITYENGEVVVKSLTFEHHKML
jgi:type 1 fimbria pilin